MTLSLSFHSFDSMLSLVTAGMTLMADSADSEAVSEGGECCREEELDAAPDSYL